MQEGTDWKFLNLEMSQIKEYVYKSLLDSTLVEFSCDVGHDVKSKLGFMALGIFDFSSIYGVSFDFNKETGVLLRESLPNHSMVIVGVDTVDGGKPNKWRIENSWGDKFGDEGYFIMTDDWFDKYGYSVVINKKYLSDDILKLLETPPVLLPAWDPLASVVSVGWIGR
jgi:bleomycin hydrolase